MKSPTDKLLKQHDKLIHTEKIKVVSHVQRVNDDWFINTLMLDGVDVPFKYKRKKPWPRPRAARAPRSGIFTCKDKVM